MPRVLSPHKISKIQVPSAHDWRTTDEDEINKRRLRARSESLRISNTNSEHPIFSNFRVKSPSGMTYSVEIRGLADRHFACDCVDFQSNGLGTCKHVEAVLLLLEAQHKRLYQAALKQGSNRIDVVPDRVKGVLRLERGRQHLPPSLRKCFSESNGDSPACRINWFSARAISAFGHIKPLPFSRSSTTSKWSGTRSMSTPASTQMWSFLTKRNASRTEIPRPPRRSNA